MSESEIERINNKLKSQLRKIPYVCTALDVFTIESRKHLLYSCYWIDSDFTRRSALLACREIDNVCEKIDAVIAELNNEYNLNDKKIMQTNADNIITSVLHAANLGFERTFDADEKCDMEKKLKFENVRYTAPKFNGHYFYPCDDYDKIKFIDVLRMHPREQKIHISVMQRINLFYKYCGDPIFTELLKSSLDVFEATRFSCWSSVYKSIKAVFAMQDQLSTLPTEYENVLLTDIEKAYLRDYLKILDCITHSIDFMKHDKNSIYGCFLSTLINVEVRLHKLLRSETLHLLKYVCQDLYFGLRQQFSDYFLIREISYDAIIASFCIPDVKFKFLPLLSENVENLNNSNMMRLLVKKIREYYHEDISLYNSDLDDYFFQFKDAIKFMDAKELRIYSQASTFLADNSLQTMTLLNKYPLMRNLFFKYNTCLPVKGYIEQSLASIGIIDGKNPPIDVDENFGQKIFCLYNTKKGF